MGESITVTTDEGGAEHCTTDGSSPDCASPLAPATIDSDMTLVCIECDGCLNLGAPSTRVYTVDTEAVVTITFPAEGVTVYSGDVMVSGTADTDIATVTVTSDQGLSRSSGVDSGGNWSVVLSGVDVPSIIITAEGTDDCGNIGSDSVTVPVEPPACNILSVGPTTGCPGVTVTISGSGFGPNTGTVTFDATLAIVNFWSDTSIVVSAPGGNYGNVVMLVTGGMCSLAGTYSYDNVLPAAPTITLPAAGTTLCTTTVVTDIACDSPADTCKESLDAGAWQDCNIGFVVGGSGIYTVDGQCTDTCGNISLLASSTFPVDVTMVGIKVREVSPIEVITCPTIGFTFTAQLADACDNPVEQAGVSVTFSTDAGELVTPTVTTDDSGQATAELILAYGVTAQVTATYNNTVTFDQVTIDDPLLVPPTAAEIESEGPPSFRTNTAIIDPDTTDNKFGLAAPLVNVDLDGAVKDGTVNMLYVAWGLTKVTGTNDIMFVGVSGLCGAPAGPSTIPCTGAETEYYIDPDSLDACNYPLIFAEGTVIDGALSVSLGGLILGFPVGVLVIELKLCDVEIAGTVTMAPWAITGDKIEGTYCPGGCASLSGFLTVTDLCALIDAVMPGMCDLVKGLLGDPDGECSGEDAYSMRLLFAANEVTLYEAP